MFKFFRKQKSKMLETKENVREAIRPEISKFFTIFFADLNKLVASDELRQNIFSYYNWASIRQKESPYPKVEKPEYNDRATIYLNEKSTIELNLPETAFFQKRHNDILIKQKIDKEIKEKCAEIEHEKNSWNDLLEFNNGNSNSNLNFNLDKEEK